MFDRFWRIFGTGATSLYVIFAFQSGLKGEDWWLFWFCMIGAVHLFSACKSHSAVKRHERRYGKD